MHFLEDQEAKPVPVGARSRSSQPRQELGAAVARRRTVLGGGLHTGGA